MLDTYIMDSRITQYVCDLYKSQKFISLKGISRLATHRFNKNVTAHSVSRALEAAGLRQRSEDISRHTEPYAVQLSGDYTVLDLPSDLIKKMTS